MNVQEEHKLERYYSLIRFYKHLLMNTKRKMKMAPAQNKTI